MLCRKELNKLKNRKLASDFVKSDLGFNEEKWKEVAEKFGAKKQFLLMQEVPTDWISKRPNIIFFLKKLQKKIKCQIHTTSTSQEKRMST